MALTSEHWLYREALERELDHWTYTSETVERLRASGVPFSPDGDAGEGSMASKLAAIRRAEQADVQLQATERHLALVEEHLRQDFALLPRSVCSKGNALYRAPGAKAPRRLIRSSSTILANSSRLSRAFEPTPSNEVLVQARRLRGPVGTSAAGPASVGTIGTGPLFSRGASCAADPLAPVGGRPPRDTAPCVCPSLRCFAKLPGLLADSGAQPELAEPARQQRMAPVVCSAADPPTAALFAALASLPERGSAAEQTVSSRRLFEAEAAAILELVDALEPKDPSVRDGWENSQALLGDWQLAYTSSSTFYENGGLTLCAPAGTCTTGELLLRFISAARGKGALEFVEPLADAAGTVVAQCSWVTASDGTLKVTPKTFTAGERSWAAVDRRGTDTVDFDRDKAIRILCACRPTYLDPSALVMRGLLPGVVWVFRRAAQESG